MGEFIQSKLDQILTHLHLLTTSHCSLPASVVQLGVRLTGDQEVEGSTPLLLQHCFMEIGHEIFATVICSLRLIQEGQF